MNFLSMFLLALFILAMAVDYSVAVPQTVTSQPVYLRTPSKLVTRDTKTNFAAKRVFRTDTKDVNVAGLSQGRAVDEERGLSNLAKKMAEKIKNFVYNYDISVFLQELAYLLGNVVHHAN
ncbi:RxLR effector protein [Phytophthora megakarya]|uniref:RxLR effector protein n=1 Tax=Phytophthora megakarya TaxID=4795 RepID=A0A225VJ77_9STRA|nr:RxLR effector protein [Phytophthora megakarya]